MGGENGKRIQSKSSLNTIANYTQTTTVAFTDYEVDRINLGKSGRQFFGDNFSQNIPSRTYINKLDNRNSAYPINYNFRFINASQGAFILSVTENSTNIFSGSLSGYAGTSYKIGEAHIRTGVFNGILPDNRSVLKFTISSASVNSVGYLDYFEITYEKDLIPVENKLFFFSKTHQQLLSIILRGFHLPKFPFLMLLILPIFK